MRKYSQYVQILLLQPNLDYFFCVQLQHSAGYLRHTTLPHDIVIGGVTYVSDNNLLSVDPPKLSTTVDREAYKISYTDPDFTLRSLFESGLTGAPISVRIGFINNSGGTLNGIPNGQPMTDVNDTVVIYGGVVDSQGYSMPDCEEIIVTIEGSSPMADLDLNRVLYTSQDAMKQRAPNDTSFDQVYVGSLSVDLLWGKA